MNREQAAQLAHAHVDGELDVVDSLRFEQRLRESPELLARCEHLREMKRVIRENAVYHAAPAELRSLLAGLAPTPATLPQRIVSRLSWRHAAAVAVLVLLLWQGAALVLGPIAERRLVDDLVASHVRSSMGNRLFDIASDDRHTVKPWLSARLNFSPPVTDLRASGYELRGGRLDYIDGQRVAVLVYMRRQHTIDVFIWPSQDDAPAGPSARRGFNVRQFSHAGMTHWIVSDLNGDELGSFAMLLEGSLRAL